MKLYKKVFGGHGIVRRMGEARFASAMAMGMMSGLNTEDAFRTAMLFQDVNQKTKKRYEKCLEMLEVGEPMAKSFRENEVLEASFCRILDLGAKSGTSDTAMAEISRRMDDRAQLEIARKVGKIEPTIVIITSILVGIVLITVMLPLIHITCLRLDRGRTENEEAEKFFNYKNCIADSGDWRTALCDECGGGKAESGAGGREHETARKLHS